MRKLLHALALVALTLAPLNLVSPTPSQPDLQTQTRSVPQRQLLPPRAPVPTTAAYTVLQMNLCLSGGAACFGRTDYPSIVGEAIGQIARRAPAAVTLNEACSLDAAEIARRTGYRLRFSAVRFGGAPIPCVDPGNRGVFGLAVLTEDAISSSRGRPFATQGGGEERRWLCATTVRNVAVCTAHLITRGHVGQRSANDAECRELRGVLTRRAQAGTTVFGGDVNRQGTCAPGTMWTTRDSAATQAAGIQHIYSSMPFDEASPAVVSARYTDHDFLSATGMLAPARRSAPTAAGRIVS